jgi:hypothetical protein
MSARLLASTALAVLTAGCVTSPSVTQPVSFDRVETCPEPIEQGLALTAFSLPIKGAGDRDTLERRIVITAAPLRAQQGTTIVWSRLSLRSLGGTFTGWTRLKTDRTLVEADTHKHPSRRSARGAATETATVSYSAGQLIVLRSALTNASLAGAVILDTTVIPGGITVDDTAMRIPRLWQSRREPLAPRDVQIQLLPVRHAPGYDGIEALVNLEYLVQSKRLKREWTCTAETQLTIVKRAAVRPPYWDIGTSKLNAPRNYWLALYAPSVGVLRAMFESPAAATAFANWVRVTGADSVGDYALGVFDGRRPKDLRPFVPVDKSVLQTFRPLEADERDQLRVGALGEP